MATAHCTIAVGEAKEAGRVVANLWSRSRYDGLAGMLLGVGGIVAGEVIAAVLGRWSGVPMSVWEVVGVGLGLLIIWSFGLPAWRRFAERRMVRRMAAYGVAGPFAVSCEPTEDALVYTVGGLRKAALWEAVDAVFAVGTWWVMMAQGEAMYLPSRAFAAPQDQRAFLQGVWTHLGAEARASSRDLAEYLERN